MSMTDVLSDARYSFRMLRSSAGFTLICGLADVRDEELDLSTLALATDRP